VTRPKYIAGELAKMLEPVKSAISLLDYGGGNAKLVEELSARGFAKCRSFDPFFSPQARPTGHFDLVTAFEVAEHAIDPLGAFRDALSCVSPAGALLFSTSLQKRRADPNWWYIAPRNGHVSIHSQASLEATAGLLGVKYLPLNDDVHIFFRMPQSPLVHLIASDQRAASLYAASRRGLRPLVEAAGVFGELGFAVKPRDLKHMVRATLISSGLV
jgi:2-polyprenyl-6-hydroxyphenyl methylase/3-demethylubiquinone-9 3-methyltransferase